MISKGFVIVLLNRVECCRNVGRIIADMVFAEDKRLYDEYQMIPMTHMSLKRIEWNEICYQEELKLGVLSHIQLRSQVQIKQLWCRFAAGIMDSRFYQTYVDNYNRAIELLY